MLLDEPTAWHEPNRDRRNAGIYPPAQTARVDHSADRAQIVARHAIVEPCDCDGQRAKDRRRTPEVIRNDPVIEAYLGHKQHPVPPAADEPATMIAA